MARAAYSGSQCSWTASAASTLGKDEKGAVTPAKTAQGRQSVRGPIPLHNAVGRRLGLNLRSCLRLGRDYRGLALDDLGLVFGGSVDGDGRAGGRQGADGGVGSPGHATVQVALAVLVEYPRLEAAVPQGIDREVVEVRIDVRHGREPLGCRSRV